MLKNSSRKPHPAHCILSASLASGLHIAEMSYRGMSTAFDVSTCPPKLATIALRKYFLHRAIHRPKALWPQTPNMTLGKPNDIVKEDRQEHITMLPVQKAASLKTHFPDANCLFLPVSLLKVQNKNFGNDFTDFMINTLLPGVDTRKQTCGREL